MTNILDRFVRSQLGTFRPQTIADLVALRLAQKLQDPAAVGHYAKLLGEYAEERLLHTFKKVSAVQGSKSMAERFNDLLAKTNGSVGSLFQVRTAAFKCERRSVAVAVFSGDHLDYTQVRQLSSAGDRAIVSVTGFVNFIIANLDIESAAVEQSGPRTADRRSQLIDHVLSTLRHSSVPLWQVSKREILDGFAYPGLRSRKDLRAAVRSIWPALGAGNGKNQILDAVALGTFVQIERRFIA